MKLKIIDRGRTQLQPRRIFHTDIRKFQFDSLRRDCMDHFNRNFQINGAVLVRWTVVLALLAGWLGLQVPQTARAAGATIVVTSTADGVANAANCPGSGCRLRDAMAAATAGDSIEINVTGTITLNQGALNVTKNLTISGPGAHLLTISGANTSRVLVFTGSVTVTVADVALSNGATATVAGGGAVLVASGQTLYLDRCAIKDSRNTYSAAYTGGGGITIQSGGTLIMTRCEVSGNNTSNGGLGFGGGINSFGTTTITASTIASNTADAGGGVYVATGTTTINGSTIAYNTAADDAGGLISDTYAYPLLPVPVVNLQNTILSNNIDNDGTYSTGYFPDIDYCSSCPGSGGSTGTINSNGYNVIGDYGDTTWGPASDPTTPTIPVLLLNPLAANGGPTRTCSLSVGSPGINRIPSASSFNGAPVSDQREYGRIGNYDPGGYEYNGPQPEINLVGNSTSIVSGDVTPSVTDDTDFGSLAVSGATLDHTFTVQNTGTGSLAVIHAWLDGTHANDFSITTAPAASVASAGSTTVTVRFDPSAAGTRSATLHISGNDANEAHYTFALQGSGSSGVTISGNAGITGASLAYTDGTPKTATADGLGDYTFDVSSPWTGTVTPSLAGYTFSPTSLSYTAISTNQTAQNFTVTSCTPQTTGSLAWSVAFSICPTGAKKIIPSGLEVYLDTDISLSSDLEVLTSGTFTPNSKTMTLTGSAAQTLTGTPLTFYNLVLNKSAAANTVTISGKLKVTKKLTITTGKLKSASDYVDIQIDADGELELTSDITVSGNFTNAGTLTAGGFGVTFDGGVSQNLAANVLTLFDNLTVSVGTTLIETVSDDNVAVLGTLTNNGVIRKTQNVTASGLQVFGRTGVEMDVTTFGGTAHDITVDWVGANHPFKTNRIGNGSYFTLTNTGGDTLSLILPHGFGTGTNIKACRYIGGAGSGWECGADLANSSDATTVTRTGVSTFSDWAPGNSVDPTVVTLRGFSAGSPALPLAGLALLVLSGCTALLWDKRRRAA